METQDKGKALQELLRLVAENPDVAERITITIKPQKVIKQGEPKG